MRFGKFPDRLKRALERWGLVAPSEQHFLRRFFASRSAVSIVHVGANDGVMCDPIRVHLGQFRGRALLIEPLPYYFRKLEALYATTANIHCLNAAIGSHAAVRDFFYVPPELAEQMDGDGPQNKWAHGQGSFSRDVIESTIRENAFRGEAYRAKVEEFIRGIAQMSLAVSPLHEVLLEQEMAEPDLLLIDVQGAEFEVLSSVGEIRPRVVMYEHDLPGAVDRCGAWLEERGYAKKVNGLNRIYVRWR